MVIDELCLVLAALAVICWPPSPGRFRRPWRVSSRDARARLPSARSWVALIAVIAGSIGLAAGWPVAIAAGLLAATVGTLVRSERSRRHEETDLVDLLAAVRTLARQVRAGGVPLAAISTTAKAHGSRAGQVLNALAAELAADRARWPAGLAPVALDPAVRMARERPAGDCGFGRAATREPAVRPWLAASGFLPCDGRRPGPRNL